MPARAEEVHHAKEEGIVFKLLCNPVQILGDEKGWVNGIECNRDGAGAEPDASGQAQAGPRRKAASFVLDVELRGDGHRHLPPTRR